MTRKSKYFEACNFSNALFNIDIGEVIQDDKCQQSCSHNKNSYNTINYGK